ncbi:MAG: CBS domain-containing protein [Acidobacteriota bacterium]|jgi:CBS domain-containing protein|nr:MAG: CBS domain-containing protein [Acidobacteriota bacterium]
MKVGDVCRRAVVTAMPGETIAEAARRMRDHHVGTVVVVDPDRGERPIGILTDRDIVVSAVAQSPDKLEVLEVGDVMTPDVVTIHPFESVRSALELMHRHGVRRLPVVDGDGRLEGLLSLDDILETKAAELDELVGLVAGEQRREREVRR